MPDQKALEMLRDFIGTDLSRLYNEVGKLKTILAPGAKVTPEVVEQYIGVSKEFNNFELIDAISVRDAAKAFRIADYFAANPKANPLVMTTAALYGFFSDLMVAFYAKDKSDAGLMKDLNLKFDKQLRKVPCRNALLQCFSGYRDYFRASTLRRAKQGHGVAPERARLISRPHFPHPFRPRQHFILKNSTDFLPNCYSTHRFYVQLPLISH